ncbi:DEAD/DEAH box helicase [Maritimibacter alkaliphilus]|uniref:DEAD/DEAH box helicase n=1 Tax=Maritimibacter alkaliphilus TaxID=404236 RepID=UPI001C94D7DB|nr:DEAD/DEAH box helicase [Maritimibacter alkaliphilus]MBY6089499.1 DEAD/DEAH box helicase [Maritimibacter alkaliphilus]
MLSPLSQALEARGYETLTPVQEAVSAPELAEKDLLVSAQTGSGKTVGFGIAIAPTLLGEAEHFGPAEAPLALVIAPTRELAFQVMRELQWLYARTGAQVASCVGGMDMRQERRTLERGAHIVVGTPGRLRDHIERGSLDMSGLRAIVLDEADEMLDLGFREDLEFMLGQAPEDRRTLLFSATVPPMIAKLAGQFQRDAERISTISKTDQHADISYQVLRVAQSDGDNAVFNLLRFHEGESAIVFANTRAAVNHLTARLTNRGLPTVSLSGELSQTERTHALQAMRDGRARVCVATDVAARGIDLPNLSLVIHAELPTNTESLLHRSGRTGRAGRKGVSALIVTPKVVKKAERLLKWAKISAEWTLPPSVEDVLERDEARLLADPSWSDPLNEDEAAFAERLLAAHSPQEIAGAFLRLHRLRHAAPEDLMSPDERGPKREPREFGPSRWISLSVGRNDRAEARWLLPLLCRAGDIEKTAIGAIRVQDSETYVELAEPAIDGFMTALGDGTLEQGITATLMEGAPVLPARSPRPPRDDRGPRGPREDRGPRGPREDRGPRGPRPQRDDFAARGPRRPYDDGDAPRGPKPAPRPRREDSAYHPDGPAEASDSRPAPKRKGVWKTEKPSHEGAHGPAKARGKPKDDKPKGGKPAGKFAKPGGKPAAKGKAPAKGGKPAGKFAKPRPGGGEPPKRKN